MTEISMLKRASSLATRPVHQSVLPDWALTSRVGMFRIPKVSVVSLRFLPVLTQPQEWDSLQLWVACWVGSVFNSEVDEAIL